jgi:predicted MPP superfamily phosphohydrolase
MAAFLRGLDSETFDMVFATGDLLGDPHSVDEVVALLNGLSGTYGRFFVLGSADHYAPEFKNYLDYFRGKRKLGTRRNPTGRFTHSLVSSGWTDLTNTGLLVEIRGMTIQITGLDDPYMGRDDRSLLRRDPEADLSILVVHDPAPYRDAGEAGYDLVVSGHTHGGQVRMPVIGALVTNSELPRQRAKWQSSLAGGGTLFVSPGLGTGRYAPFRFLSRPEASILVLNEKP